MPRWRGAAHRFSSPRPAGRACAAADPGKHRDRAADRHVRIRAGPLDHAGDLVAEREGQRARAARDVELLVAAEAEIAVLQVQVGMAHAAAADRAPAPRCRAAPAPRRRSRTAAPRRRSSIGGSCGSSAAQFLVGERATKPSTAISSARAVGSIPAASSSGIGIDAERPQALRAASCGAGRRRPR